MTGETYLQFNSIMYIKCYLDDNASVQCYLGWGISYDDAHNSSHGEIFANILDVKTKLKIKTITGCKSCLLFLDYLWKAANNLSTQKKFRIPQQAKHKNRMSQPQQNLKIFNKISIDSSQGLHNSVIDGRAG